MYVWGDNGSFFIPLNIAAAKQHGKAHYILPGWLAPLLEKTHLLEFRSPYVQSGGHSLLRAHSGKTRHDLREG